MLNNRGQISDTMTWFVATIVIVVILGIGILISSGNIVSNKKTIILQDKQKDFIGTKSIANFLSEDFDFVKTAVSSGDYVGLENKLKSFLQESLFVSRCARVWNLKVNEENVVFEGGFAIRYVFDFRIGEDKLKFWEVNKEQCF